MSAAAGVRNAFVILCLLSTAACGTRSYVVADTAKYPVSMSSVVRDENARVVPPTEMQKLGTFKDDYTTCSMLWTIIPLGNRTRDISKRVNEEVAQREGEAVVNLRVEASAFVSSIANIFGILPDCNRVRVRGDIVQRNPALSNHRAGVSRAESGE